MAADELTKALLLEEVAAPQAIGRALLASVSGKIPLVYALIETGAASPEVLTRYIERAESPFLHHVVPVPELIERLPPGLCQHLLALPVRHDAITGTVDVAVVDASDPHPAREIGFHLGTPVRIVRAPLAALEDALRRLQDPTRGRARSMPNADGAALPAPGGVYAPGAPPSRRGLVLEPDSIPPPQDHVPAATSGARAATPPWGTPIHVVGPVRPRLPTEPPTSGYGSEIPIPLTRKTFYPGTMSGGTQRPPAFVDPRAAGLGEGYAFDTTGLRDIVERTAAHRFASAHPPSAQVTAPPPLSFIPGPPPLPDWGTPARGGAPSGAYAAYAPELPFPEMGGVSAALRNAGSRDEILELVLTGARMVALKVALFVVKKGGYLGWLATPEFADRASLQSILIPLDANSVFDRAVREDIYLGPIRHDDVHAPLLRVMRHPSRDVAIVPVRVSGKTAVIIVADGLGDTMLGTRRLEELARAAGDAFARVVRARR